MREQLRNLPVRTLRPARQLTAAERAQIERETQAAMREASRAEQRKYREANRERIAAEQRKYYEANRERWRTVYAANRRAKLAKARS